MNAAWRLLLVTWRDHVSFSGWKTVEAYVEEILADSLLCQSVGWVIHEDERTLSLAQNWENGGKISEVMTILKSEISSVEVLKEANP